MSLLITIKIFRMQEKMYALVEQWKQSGLSKKLFSQQEGLTYDSFLYWSQKYDKVHAVSKGREYSGFVPLQLTPEVEALDIPIEISYPNGVKVKVASSIGFAEFQKLVQIF